MQKTTRGQQDPRRPEDTATRRSKDFELRWSSVRPIDFEGEDESLTQAELAVLK